MRTPRPLPPDRQAVLDKIRDYEGRGGEYFFRDVEDDPPARVLMPQDVDYLHETARFKINGFFSRLVERVCGCVVRRRYAVTVTGAEHLRGLTGGAVFTSNHFSVTENLAVKWAGEAAPGRHRMYKLVREGNYSMPGVIGWLLKYCDTLPLSSHLGTMKLLDRAVAQLLKEGNFLLIYPEQAMWWYYQKPRPYRLGAYYYAAKNGVPVVPCFITLHPKNPKREMLPDNVRYAVHVMPLIYPRADRAPREEARRMREENARLCREMYERVYGVPLRYETQGKSEEETVANA